MEQLNLKLHALTIFRGILQDTVMQKLLLLLDCKGKSQVEQVNLYADFTAELYSKNDNLTRYVLNLILEDENVIMLRYAQGMSVDGHLNDCLQQELATLQQVGTLTSADVKAHLAYTGFLPEWNTEEIDYMAEYTKRIANIGSHGYGMFAKYHMFIIRDSAITPVQYPDDTQLTQLIGYKAARQQVIDNTLALLNDKPAANVLLYGDAGTGKSSTVKAVVNRYKDRGLRLIEIEKKQLRDIPSIIDALSKNPLKFILFIDDLSFSSNDDDFGALKAILEGSVSARTSNIAIYATSNRRHLIKENFFDRDGNEVHYNDTVQELTSLSDRFGLTVLFTAPGKNEYLEIVAGLAAQQNIALPQEELFLKAEQFALLHSGRSARVAKQFIEHLLAQG